VCYGDVHALGVTNSAVQAPLLLFGTEPQKKKYLRRMATGETLGAFWFDGAGGGVGCRGDQGARDSRRNAYKLSGTKTWVTNGSAAGVVAGVCENRSCGGRERDFRVFGQPGFAGFRVGRHEDKMGQRSSPSVEILLNDVSCRWKPAGGRGQGEDCVERAGWRAHWIAAQAVGLAQGALEETVKYAKQRSVWEKYLASFRHSVDDCGYATEIEAARGLTHHAAWLKDAHPTKVGASSSKGQALCQRNGESRGV